MFPILYRALIFLLPISLLSTLYLYAYPTFHGCAFPSRDGSIQSSVWTIWKHISKGSRPDPRSQPPFRLLTLGDPQLEGDSSLPNPEDGYFPSLALLRADLLEEPTYLQPFDVLSSAFRNLFVKDLPRILQSWRKQLDLFGNDYYLAHIYRSMYRATNPTHVTVLGDLIGSQWIDDAEFESRGWRFWQRVFRHGQRVEDDITNQAGSELLGKDPRWKRRIINIAGNHDVGYAGDMSAERIERFNRVFGRANWEIKFQLLDSEGNNVTMVKETPTPELRIVILNSLNLDTPVLDQELQGETYAFINEVIGRSRPVEDRTTGTILLTHLPLHKDSGTCVDSPFFDFYSEEHSGGLKEQNHISYDAGKGILEGIFGMSGNPDAPGKGFGRNGIILTGHDHEGCDVYHHLPDHTDKDARHWEVARWRDAQKLINESIPGIREITVRSMMGDFGGNAGLLSAWFDRGVGEWRFEYSSCSVGVQHIWWAVHVVDLVTLGLLLFLVVSSVVLDMSTSAKIGTIKAEHKEAINLSPSLEASRGVDLSGGHIINANPSDPRVRKRRP